MVAIMGTSTCHVMNHERVRRRARDVRCRARRSRPGCGAEAGQSGVGDIFGWYVDHFVGARYHEEAAAASRRCTTTSPQLAAEQEVGEHGLVALDWESGNRSVLVDHELGGLIVGLTLGTRPPDVIPRARGGDRVRRAHVVETLEAAGVPVREIVVASGLMQNRFVMQIYADVLRTPATP